MNVIIAYLETMFSAYPQSPRLLEAKSELHAMMEDAYTTLIAEGRSENEAVGQVIRDFGNLDEVAPVLGIASDITPPSPAAGAPARTGEHPVVTMEEARGYADAQQRIRFRVSTAIMLFVLSPTLLISLPTAASAGVVPFSEGVGTFIGLLTLLILVGTGVLLIVSTARDTSPYSHIDQGKFTANPAVTRWAKALAHEHDHARIRALQIALALWILAAVPLIAFALLLADSPLGGFWTVIGVVLVLVFVAAGLGVLLPRAWAHTVATRLDRTSVNGTSGGEGEHSVVGVIAAFYWPLLVAIFLAWSFIGNAWGISWVVWPIGGVLFGAIAAGTGAIESYRKDR